MSPEASLFKHTIKIKLQQGERELLIFRKVTKPDLVHFEFVMREDYLW